MYTAREIKPAIILSFAWPSLLFYLVYSVCLCSLNYFGHLAIGFSFVPIGLIGTAVAFYVGFKNNSSYERLWEARRIWGALVNASRTWGTYTLSYVKTSSPISDMDEQQLQTKLIHGLIAYINAIRIQLRQKSVWNNSNTTAHTVVKGGHENAPLHLLLSEFLTEQEVKYFLSKKNPATHILKSQATLLDDIFRKGGINERFYVQMMAIVQEFYNQQGAAERIKNFPFPRQYAYFSKVFVWLFILVLPFGLINEFAKLGEDMIWIAVPAYMIIAWVFNTMEIVGDTSENPFENAINDVPMTAICRTIEIDLREMLEEKSIPPAITAVDNILM
ncbi:bestrophin family protein [Dyadobacter psychrotolerans]|uniref:Multidrug transporter n=1 Tax=Dyadobacter psychrotolerans TaxID=2541721 RepID=A0A4R5DSZ1_9BACT|nr:bestrophin family ion channel [Dyadobacter psychrotolerans]TDE17489.1 hypothetical protein E0F88_06260 [Dyadobacter psychrotolerans]